MSSSEYTVEVSEMANGRVYWITGFSNSGKTTIGTALYYELKKSRNNVIILDGDLIKEVTSGTELVGYENSDRMIRARRYSQMSKLLADQGVWVIVCAIAMFDEVRRWNRENIKGYVEIFLDTPDEVLKARDRKGLYKAEHGVEIPKNPDIVFSNDGTESIRKMTRQILEFRPKNEEDYDRDREYWNSYYKEKIGKKIEPSDFAIEVEKKINRNSHIMELGCGNGRDSLYFLSKGHNVIAVDGSDVAIEMLNELTVDNKNALFACDNFVKCKALYQMKYDCIYSRFTLHAISEEQENELLENIKGALNEDGILCIEARTIHDDIFGMGKKVANNAYIYNEHFRRFIDVNKFHSKLEELGFCNIFINEAHGFSKTEESDPVLMRCIAGVKERK